MARGARAWASVGLFLFALSCLVVLACRRDVGSAELLDWWKPSTATGPVGKEGAASRGRRGREPLSLSGQGKLAAAADDSMGEALGSIKGKIGVFSKAARETELSDDDDKLSEAELASRLGRAIDRHEKCRRHWPHLESLESAQEIRVHDARNNLEVANRGMERARKELIDAENLVMAARSVSHPVRVVN